MLAGSDVDAAWTQIRVIELERLLPVNALPISCDFIGSVQGFGVFFVGTKDGLYSVDIKCGTTRKGLQAAITGEGSGASALNG
ncbi:hypothetical protein EJB05_14417, partial [Eragrostis curvula]